MNDNEHADNLGLDGRVVLVTGAGRGLGFSYAETLARCGAHVIVHDGGVAEDGTSPDPAVAKDVAAQLCDAGGSAFAVTEVLDGAASCRRIIASALEKFGRLDGLIHNAGLVVWCDPADVDDRLYRRLTDVGNDAAFWLCSAALPIMRRQGFGRIVLTSSSWALEPYQGSNELILYSHGKGAQLGLAMALANGAGHPDILTNVIAPVAKTRILRADVPDGSFRPESVAGAVVWMVSPACDMTGTIVRASNGALSLMKLTAAAERDLGDDASDPRAAGAALTAMAAGT